MTAIVRLLLLADMLLRIQHQLVELSSMKLIHCHLHWQDRIEIVACPLHSVRVEIITVLHRDEVSIQVWQMDDSKYGQLSDRSYG